MCWSPALAKQVISSCCCNWSYRDEGWNLEQRSWPMWRDVPCWAAMGHPQCSLCGTANMGQAGPAAQMHCLQHSSGHQLTEQSCPALLAQAQHLFLLQNIFQLSFSQIPPALEARIPLIVVYINKYEVSAWFSSIHLLAKDKLQGFAAFRAFSLPCHCRVSNVLLNDLFEVKLCPYKLPLHSSETFSGCTTHPAVAIPDNKMTGGERLEKMWS